MKKPLTIEQILKKLGGDFLGLEQKQTGAWVAYGRKLEFIETGGVPIVNGAKVINARSSTPKYALLELLKMFNPNPEQ